MLPEDLNHVLIIVVVLSMALTPGLAELGKVSGVWLEDLMAKQRDSDQPLVDALAANDAAKVEEASHAVSFRVSVLRMLIKL